MDKKTRQAIIYMAMQEEEKKKKKKKQQQKPVKKKQQMYSDSGFDMEWYRQEMRKLKRAERLWLFYTIGFWFGAVTQLLDGSYIIAFISFVCAVFFTIDYIKGKDS